MQSLRTEKVNNFYSMFWEFFPFLSYSDYVPEEDTFQLYMRSGVKNEQTKSIEYFYIGKIKPELLFPKKSKFHIKLDSQHNS